MKLRILALLAILCLPINTWTLEEEREEQTTPDKHKEELTDEEKDQFKQKLDENAKKIYTEGNFSFKDSRTRHYKARAQKLDNDIKRYIIDPNKLKELKEEELKSLQERLEGKIMFEEERWWNNSSKALREQLMNLKASVDSRIAEKKGQPFISDYSKRQLKKNIEEIDQNQQEIDTKQEKLIKLQETLISRQRDFAHQQELIQSATNKNNDQLVKTLKEKSNDSTKQISELEEKIEELSDGTQDLQDRMSLNHEDIYKAFIKLLGPQVSQEFRDKIKEFMDTIETTQFIDSEKYFDNSKDTQIIDPRVEAIQKVIEKLRQAPQTKEIIDYINLFKNVLKNHFTALQNEAFRQYNQEESNYLKINPQILKLEHKMQQAKGVSDIPGKNNDIQKIRDFIKQQDEDIVGYEAELKELQKNKNKNGERIQQVKRLIEQAKNDKNTELLELGLTQKKIKSYSSLGNDQENLKKLEEQRTQSRKKSEKIRSLQEYFGKQVKAY